jgi:hypothetical protein
MELSPPDFFFGADAASAELPDAPVPEASAWVDSMVSVT